MTTSTEHKLLQAVKEDAAKELEAEAIHRSHVDPYVF